MGKKNLFIGCGGCGINTVTRLIKGGLTGDFLCIGADKSHLDILPANVTKIFIPRTVEFPLKEPYFSQIKTELGSADRVFLFLGLGGNTGSALAIQLSQMWEMEIYATYPFSMEKTRRKRADEALSKIIGEVHIRQNDELLNHPDAKSKGIRDLFMVMDDQLYLELKKSL